MASIPHMYSYVIPVTLTPGQSLPVSIVTEADSTFIVEKMYALNDAPFTVLFKDSLFGYQWANAPVRCENIFGTVEFPAELIDPIALPASTELTANLVNLDLINPNSIEIVLEGYRVYTPVEMMTRRWFQYVKDFALPASDSVNQQLQINGDSDFLVRKLIANKDYEASLKMSSTEMGGRNLTSQFISLGNQFGRALLPNKLKHPLKISRLTLMDLELRNQAALPNNVQLCFEGVKMWGNQYSPTEPPITMARK